MLTQDAAHPEGTNLGLAESLAGLGGDVADDSVHPRAYLLARQMVPAGRRSTPQRFNTKPER